MPDSRPARPRASHECRCTPGGSSPRLAAPGAARQLQADRRRWPPAGERHGAEETAATLVTVLDTGQTFRCPRGELILDAGLEAGIGLPHNCRGGACGTCKSQILEGEVDHGWVMSFAISDEEKAAGKCLICQSRPLTPTARDPSRQRHGAGRGRAAGADPCHGAGDRGRAGHALDPPPGDRAAAGHPISLSRRDARRAQDARGREAAHLFHRLRAR